MKRILFFIPLGLFGLILTLSWQPDKGAMERGKKVYNLYCLSCHLADGAGIPKLNPPVAKTKAVVGSKTKLIQLILKGMNTDEPINGEVYSNSMAPLDYLTDEQVADVLTYVRNSFGNKASSVSPAEVRAARAKTK